MRPVTFSLDRQENTLYVYSDLWGFYLCGTDHERVISSIIPLAQHLLWKNEKACMVPEDASEFRRALLSEKTATVRFVTIEKLRPPEIPQKGWWWGHKETDKQFFVPASAGDTVDSVILAKITFDRERDNNGPIQ